MGQMIFTTDGAVTGWIDFNLLTYNVHLGDPSIYGYIGLAGYYISYGYLSFDTSTLPANCTVTGATLTLRYTLLPSDPTHPSTWVHKLYAGKDVIGAALDSGDFGAAGFQLDQNYNPTNGENIITLGAKGRDAINKDGKTDFEFRDASLASGGSAGWNAWFYGTSTSRGAKLAVTYNLPRLRNCRIKNANIKDA